MKKYYRVVYRSGFHWDVSFGVEGVKSQQSAIDKTRPFMMESWNSRYARKYKKPIAYLIDQETFEELKPFEKDPQVRH